MTEEQIAAIRELLTSSRFEKFNRGLLEDYMSGADEKLDLDAKEAIVNERIKELFGHIFTN